MSAQPRGGDIRTERLITSLKNESLPLFLSAACLYLQRLRMDGIENKWREKKSKTFISGFDGQVRKSRISQVAEVRGTLLSEISQKQTRKNPGGRSFNR